MGVQLRTDPITASDLCEYLAMAASDFAFELRTLKLLQSLKLECAHGGMYEDPVTKRARQFDIRATARVGRYCVRLAIECKNIGANYPLLVSRVPRHPNESFHEIAIVGEIEDGANQYGAFESRAHIVKVESPAGLYKAHAPVGKALAQVGRQDNQSRSIRAQDEGIFEKWSQSLASADELVTASYYEGSDDSPSISYVAILPIVVVPEGRLWVADFDSDGNQTEGPKVSDHCSLFVNHSYRMEINGPDYRISHVEFVTLSRLWQFVVECLKGREALESIFPSKRIEEAEEDLREGRYS